jgi:ABC-type sugar transport system ATPase subunit
VAIRPEHVSLGGTIPAEVTEVVFQGSFKRVTARANGIVLLARLSAETEISPGQHVMFGIDPNHAIVLRD